MMSTVQKGDVLLFQTEIDGNILYENGLVHMTTGPDTMIYLCLGGGNKKDNASPDTKKFEYCGNEDEPQQRQLRSRFQSLLSGIPLCSGNIQALEDAAVFDLTSGFGARLESIRVDLSITSLKSVYLVIQLKIEGRPYEYRGAFSR